MSADAPAAVQDPFLAERLRESAQIRERSLALTAGLDEGRLYWPQPDRGWSIAQVFEHLALSTESYLDPLRRAIEDGHARGRTGLAQWRPTLVGRLLLHAVDPANARRSPAPKAWRPDASIRRDVVNAFVALQGEVETLTATADGLDVNRVRLSSPVSRLVRLSLGDVLTVLNRHALRHLAQVERIRGRTDFPPG